MGTPAHLIGEGYGVLREPIGPENRRAVWHLDQGRCRYCGRATSSRRLGWERRFTVDHRVPLSRGGTSILSNLVCSCWACNVLKDNLTEAEFCAISMEIREGMRRELVGIVRRIGGDVIWRSRSYRWKSVNVTTIWSRMAGVQRPRAVEVWAASR